MESPPTTGPWSWSIYDAQWEAMERAGLRLYLTLFDGAPGATAYPGDDADPTTAATERANWAAQALDVAQYLEANYPRLLAAIEVWNEPDGNWPIPAADYVLLAAAVKTAIRSDPSLNHIPIVGPASSVSPGTYWQGLIDNGIAEELDWISHHTYTPPAAFEARFDAVREKLAQVNAESLPIVLSEWGAEDAAVAYEIASGLTALKAVGTHGASYFPLRDYSTFPAAGLIESDGTAKTQTIVWNTWHANIGGDATYIKRDPDLPFTIQSHEFSVGGSPVRVVWASDGTPSIDVSGSYTAEDAEGTGITAGATQVLGASPIYIFGGVTITLTAGQDVLLAGNTAQFSGVQGQDGWSYHARYSDGSYLPGPTFDAGANRWELAGEGGFTIASASSHPDATGGNPIQAARRWTVPAGVNRVKVVGTWARTSGSGDGSDVALWHNDTVRFRRAALIGATADVLQVFDVAEGDLLEFCVGPGPGADDLSFDNTVLGILIYLTEDAVTPAEPG
jgi:hypothetical protein